MRMLPYPFGAALAVTSDVDFCNRDRYTYYVGALVEQHGLDFGDSIWLTQPRPSEDRPPRFPGLGVLSADFRIDYDHYAQLARQQFDLIAVMREHHLGNIDHWHAFLPLGPRVFIFEEFSIGNDGVLVCVLPERLERRDRLSKAADFRILAASVIARDGKPLGVRSLTVVGGSGVRIQMSREHDHELYPFLADSSRDASADFLTTMYDADAPVGAIDLRQLERVEIEFENAEDANRVAAVCLHDVHSQMLLDRLAMLDERYHFSTNLITAHSFNHFVNERKLSSVNDTVGRLLTDRHEIGRTYYGTFAIGDSQLSTVADDEASFARVMPELADDCGILHYRLAQGKRYAVRAYNGDLSDGYCDVLDVVCPLMTRNGAAFYNLSAAFPEFPEHLQEQPELDPTRSSAANFAPRLAIILDDLARERDRVAVFYTHLGNWGGAARDDNDIDLDQPPVHELKNRCYNIGGEVDPPKRIWFTRASVLSDYALMMQALPESVDRTEPDVVRIRSWDDAVLKRRLPLSILQLYGLTFYVESSAKARVFLDESEIHDLVRNPADETGRESITIAACGIRHVIFDHADPRAVRAVRSQGGDWREDNARWEWLHERADDDTERGFGRLSAQDAGASARVMFSCADLKPVGAQLLALRIQRSSEQARFAMIMETTTGGRFFFGDEEILDDAGEITAAGLLDHADRAPESWRTHVLAFHNLRWRTSMSPGKAPMPSHPVASVTLLMQGGSDDWIDIDRIEFGRPKTTTPRGGPAHIVLGGRVVNRDEGATLVALRRHSTPEAGAKDISVRTATIDPLGGFCFGELPRGAYALATCASSDAINWERPHIVEANADRFDVVL